MTELPGAKKKAATKKPGAKALKASAKTGGAKPPKPDAADAAKVSEASKAIVKLRSHAEAAKDPKVAESALDAIAEIQKNWTKWQESKATQKKVGFECKAKQDADEEVLKAAIEEPLPVAPLNDRVKKALVKIELVEQRWQELADTKAANTEQRKAAKDRTAMWLDKLQRALTESAQLTLPAPGMK